MKIGILVLVALSVSLLGCPGAMDSLSSSINGAKLTEVETRRLVCGRVQFGDRVSISCVKK